jgi:hypothetical protein
LHAEITPLATELWEGKAENLNENDLEKTWGKPVLTTLGQLITFNFKEWEKTNDLGKPTIKTKDGPGNWCAVGLGKIRYKQGSCKLFTKVEI